MLYLVVHECYILEERLKVFFSATKKFAGKRGIDIDVKAIGREVMKLHKKTFGTLLRWRGTHVHEDEFSPRDIKRIGLIDLMIVGEKLGHGVPPGSWSRMQREAVKQARKNWIKDCEKIQEAAGSILRIAFRRTKPVWSRISKGDLT